MLIANLERLRALPRSVEITRTLVHHGLHDLVHSAGLHKVIDEAGGMLGWRPDPAMLAKPLPERLREALEALGPAFVKLGQVLASRVDLLGPDWIASLDRLHDRAQPVPFAALETQLLADLGIPIAERFAAFDVQPAAAGSIAQVHRAQLPDGTAVAVKIRRPGVQAAVEADLVLLEALAGWWEEENPLARRFQPRELVRQLRKSLAREVDFAIEARSQQRFAESFRGDPGIVVPGVHGGFTRASLLVMDWIDGVPGTDMARLDAQGFDRAVLAARGADAVLKMVLVDGMFHADPHPGNVIFLAGDRVALIDFGMVGWLSEKRRDELIDLLAAVAGRDPQAMRDVLVGWTDGGRRRDDGFVEDLGRLLHMYENASLRDVRLGTLLSEIAAIMREHHLMLPADLALLFKALITLEGLGTRLVPGFRLIEHVTPFVRRLLTQRWQPGEIASRLGGSARELGRAARAAPRLLDALARRFGDENLALRFEVPEISEFSRRMEASVNRVTIGLVTAALIVGSSILMSVARSDVSALAWLLGTVGIVIAFANSIWLLTSIRRARRATTP